MREIVIGVTDCSKYDAYAQWISGTGKVRPVRLSPDEDYRAKFEACDGLLLTGGEDVHPRFYNKPEYFDYCYKEDINERRDEMELDLLAMSQQKQVPVLGICRGLQVGNVYFGGTLIPDIPSFGKFNHSKSGGSDRYHQVTIDPNSQFHGMLQLPEGEINSAHHQSAELVAPELVVNAISQDGVIEGLEWKKPEGKPYLLFVQWHPERMRDQQSPFSRKVKSSFIAACEKNVD
jgi:putative glutamine amidotransferase